MTQWDDDRVMGKIELQAPSGHQQEIGQTLGHVVRIHDLGPPDGRLDKPSLMFDSEMTHGSLGVFGDEQEAEEFAGRRREATLAGARAIETLHQERSEHVTKRQLVLWEQRDKAKREAQEANARAKKFGEEAELLAREADEPEVEVECGIGAHGFTIYATACLTDGNIGGERRELHGLGQSPEAQQVLDPVTEKRRASRKKKHPKRGPSSQHVPDTSGLPIRVGTRVEVNTDDGVQEAEVTEVLSLLPTGSKFQQVQVQLDGGEVLVVLAQECVRVEL